MKQFLCAVALSAMAFTSYCQEKAIEPVIVTANKFETEQNKASQPAYVLDEKFIENHNVASVSELLNLVPNLQVRESNGNSGAIQSYTLRGGSSKDVLILVNGLPAGDDSNINPFYDLNLMPTEQVERIEVISGGSSVLYGAGASAGVINIILKEKQDELATAKIEGGSWGTHEETITLGTTSKNEKLNARIGFTNFGTKGFSAAKDTITNNSINFDDDKASKQNLMATVGFKPINNFSTQFNGFYNQHKYDFDGGAYSDGKDQRKNQEIKGQLFNKFSTENVDIHANLGFANYDRTVTNPDLTTDGKKKYNHQSTSFNADVFAKTSVSKSTFIGGLYFKSANTDQYGVSFVTKEYNQTIAKDSANFNVLDPYLSVSIQEIKGLKIDLGSRFNTHSNYDNKLVWNTNANYELPIQSSNVKLHVVGGLNSAYITPTLFQLYSQYGKQSLTPEESTSYDAGLQFYFNDKYSLTGTYFNRDEENKIGFSTTTFKYDNLDGKTNAKGFELQATAQPIKEISAKVFYSKTERNISKDFWRQPKDQFGLSLTGSYKSNTNATLDVKTIGQRIMPMFNPVTFKTDEVPTNGYTAMNFTVNHSLFNNQLQVFGAVKNLLNEDLIDALGYNAEGTNFRVGAKFQFTK